MNSKSTFTRIVASLLAIIMVFGAFTAISGIFGKASAATVNHETGEITYGASNSAIVLNKDAWLAADGTYCIDLTAYITGEKPIAEQQNEAPTDFIIVMDQSCLMQDNASYDDNEYGFGTFSIDTYKQTAVKSIAHALIEELRSPAHGGADHRVSLVGFGAYSCNAGDSATGLYDTNGDWYNYQFSGTSTYAVSAQHKYNDTLTSVNTVEGYAALNKALLRSPISSGAYTNAGLDMARGIIAATGNDTYTVYNADGSVSNVPRNKVVILITDGTPGWDGFDMNIAANAVNIATSIKKDYGAKIYSVALSTEVNELVNSYDWAGWSIFSSNYGWNNDAAAISSHAYDPAYGNASGAYTTAKYNTLRFNNDEFYSRDFTTVISSVYPCTENYGPNGPVVAKYITNSEAYNEVGQSSSGALSYSYIPAYNFNGNWSGTYYTRSKSIGYFYTEANGSRKLISGFYDNNVRNYNNRIAYNNHPLDKANESAYSKYYFKVPNAKVLVNGSYTAPDYSNPTQQLRSMINTFITEIPTVTNFASTGSMNTIGDAYIKDIISEYFKYHDSFDVNTNVKTFTQDAIGYQNGEYVFENNLVPYNGAIVSRNGDVVTVGGFDYDANTCYMDSTVHGKKFVVQIRGLLAKSDTIGTVEISNTPTQISGLYSGAPAGGNSGSNAPAVTGATLYDITVKPDSSKIPTISVEPADANYTVVWTSSNTNVATVDANSGKVTGKNPGTATLTAKITDKVTGETITKVSAITVPQPTTGNNGGSSPISQIASIPAIKLIKGSGQLPVINVIPANADYSVSYSLSNPNVATFNEDGLLIGRTEWTSGTITITITDNVTGQTYPRTVNITTYPDSSAVNVSTVGLNNITVVAGSSKTPVLSVTGTNSTNPTNYSTTWTVGDPTIATVNANGKVTGVKNGTTTITATVTDNKSGTVKTASATVTVVGGAANNTAPITGASVEPLLVVKGSSKLPCFYVSPNEADYTVTWSSGNPSVASVDPATGMVTGVNAGAATVTATIVDNANNTAITRTANVTVINDSNGNTGSSDSIIVVDGEEAIFPVPVVSIRDKHIVYDFSLKIKDDNARAFFETDENTHDVKHVLTIDDAYIQQTQLANGSYDYHQTYPYANTARHIELAEHFEVGIEGVGADGQHNHADNDCQPYVILKNINCEEYDVATLLELTSYRKSIVTGESEPVYEWCRVYFLPATNVHYEESLIRFSDSSENDAQWQVEGTANGQTYDVNTQTLIANTKYDDANQDTANTIYGFEGEYQNNFNGKMRETHGDSNGRAMSVTVNKNLYDLVRKGSASWPNAQFEFRGTGFEIMSRSGLDTGVFAVDVVPAGQNWNYSQTGASKHLVVDTFFSQGLLYQIPVIHITDLMWGEYQVRVTALYNEVYDHILGSRGITQTTKSGTKGGNVVSNIPGLEAGVEYEVVTACDNPDTLVSMRAAGGTFTCYIDAVRVYNPLVASLSDSELKGHLYYEADEHNPEFSQIRRLLIAQGDFGSGGRIDGMIYYDGSESNVITVDEYAYFGPNNETYIRSNHGVAFTIKDYVEGETKVQISAKSPNAKSVVMRVNGQKFIVDSATEMFFDITDAIEDGRVAITCDANGETDILSVCQIKLITGVKTRSISSSFYVDSATIANATEVNAAPAVNLSKPYNFKGQLVDNMPTITWSAVSGAVSYNVYRAIKATELYTLIGNTTELCFVDTEELSPLTRYYYKVCAADIHGNEGPFSNYAYVTTYGLKAPTVTLSIVERKPMLTWNEITNATKYQIYRRSIDGEYALIATVIDTTFTDEDETLEAGKKYYYKVCAIDDLGITGAFSKDRYITTYYLATPVVTLALAERKPQASWKAVANATKYEVYRKSVDGEYSLIATVTGTTFRDESSLEAGKKYYYQVRALDDYGTASAFSKDRYITTYYLATPVVTLALAERKPQASWKAVANATKYEVYRKSVDGEYSLIATVTGTTFRDESSLEAGKKYYYQVRALDDYGTASAFSKDRYITTYYVAAPTGVKATLDGSTPIVTWYAAKNATRYEVYRALKDGEYTLIATVTDTIFEDDSALTAGSKYYYRLRALDDYGTVSAYTAARYVTIPKTTAPAYAAPVTEGR